MSIERDVSSSQKEIRNLRTETPVSALSTWLSMPALVACWDMRSIDSESRIYDHSGQGRVLEMMNGFTQNSGTPPYISLTNAQWLFRYRETGIANTGQMTIALWVKQDVLAAGTLVGCWYTTNNQRVWNISVTAGGVASVSLSLLGTAVSVQTQTSSKILVAGAWSFLAFKFVPNTELSIFHNMTKSSLLAGVIANMYAGYPKLCINGIDWGTAALSAMNIGLAAQYNYALSDASIYQLFQSSRGWYGV